MWAPSTHLGAQKPHTNVPLTEIQSVINRAGPFPTIAIWRLEKDLLLKLCTDPVAQHTYCNLLLYFTGSSDKQIVLPGYAGILDLASINELHQHVQSMQKGRTHFFDFNDEAKHMALYGQPKPPAYDLRRIESRSISIWWTYRDTLSKPEAIKATMRDLRGEFLSATMRLLVDLIQLMPSIHSPIRRARIQQRYAKLWPYVILDTRRATETVGDTNYDIATFLGAWLIDTLCTLQGA